MYSLFTELKPWLRTPFLFFLQEVLGAPLNRRITPASSEHSEQTIPYVHGTVSWMWHFEKASIAIGYNKILKLLLQATACYLPKHLQSTCKGFWHGASTGWENRSAFNSKHRQTESPGKKKETEKIAISVCITLLMTAPSNPYFYKVPQRKPLVATHPICIRPPSPSNKKAMVGCSHKCPCPSKTWAATGAKTICALLRSIFFRTQFWEKDPHSTTLTKGQHFTPSHRLLLMKSNQGCLERRKFAAPVVVMHLHSSLHSRKASEAYS